MKEFLFRVWPTVCNFPKKTNSVLFQGTISNIKKQNTTYGMKWGDFSNQIRQTLKLTNLCGNLVSRTFLLFDTRSKCESFYAITTHFKKRIHLLEKIVITANRYPEGFSWGAPTWKYIPINMQQIYKKHPSWSVISIKLTCNFIEIKLQRGCSPVNLLHIYKYLFS